MKRILVACLNQTIHFQLKPEISHGVAERDVKAECENYKISLKNGKIKFRIINEKVQKDGSIILKVKKQINNYDVGDYLD
jgi:hypothetical protein